MSARRRKPAFKVGDMVRTRYYVPGVPFGISAEMMVDVVDVSIGRAPEMPRYRVRYCGGSPLWVYEDVLEAMGQHAR